MAMKSKQHGAAQANPDASASDYTAETSDQASSNSGEIIYTPPESVSSMTSSSSEDANSSNISKREYIYMLPYPLPPNTPIPYSTGLPEKNPLNLPPHQFEPTNTLVLTSPARTFVDIRMYKPFHTTAPTPNQGHAQHLEWAFAGTSASRPLTIQQHGKSQKRMAEDAWENLTHSTWTHWVDSRWPVGTKDIPIDEGDMYPIAENLTLEVGHAFHPDVQAVKTHEEMWRDLDVQSTNSRGTRVCVVMRCQADAEGVRGVVVRLGRYCQGILMKGEECTVERWEWDGTAAGEEEVDKWQRAVRVGDLFLPCSVTFRPEIVAVGGKIKFCDFEWVVEEAWEW